MNKYISICLAAVAMCMTSCNFLDREPLDFGSENSYFKSDADLKISVNNFYEELPLNNSIWGGLYTADIISDNQCSSSAQNLFYKGDKKTVKVNDSEWNFSNLRSINFFINKTEEVIDQVTGDKELARHYLGEGYFFRAYDYFRLLRNFGDVPIVTTVQNSNPSELTDHSVRYPRNEVARFIIQDLDTAVKMLLTKAPESGRVTRDAALALMARVALYEATWEKYHAGTCFVPGNSKWPGKDVWPNFTFKAGSAEAEVNYFLDVAISASKEVADAHPLDKDYPGMFTSTKAFADGDEVLLARYYQSGILTHSCSAYLKNGGGCGVTRAAVNTYLMKNGLPIYADGSGYKGDTLSYYELQDRDGRLTNSVKAAGSIINTKKVDGRYVNDTVFYYRPMLWNSGHEKSTTGYELKKWLSSDVLQQTQYQCTTAVPILRAAECYMDYIEAYYERYGVIDNTADTYWRALRTRAGVDPDYNKTIAATDLTKENDLAVWSKGVYVDKTLYNIRRERRCEFVAEGTRLDDLKRWRALDTMVKYQPEGFNLWTKMYTMYSSSQIDESVVSQKSISDYVHPLQISSTSAAYDGYTFPLPHYLEPIPISEFLLTVSSKTGKSTLYQNPGWPSNADGTADYNYDCR